MDLSLRDLFELILHTPITKLVAYSIGIIVAFVVLIMLLGASDEVRNTLLGIPALIVVIGVLIYLAMRFVLPLLR